MIVKNSKRISLNETKEKKLKEFILSKGYEIVYENYNINDLGCVAGIESFELYLAAYRGLETILVEDNYSSNIYKKIFPENIIFSS